MKSAFFLNLLTLGLLVAFAATGCKKPQKGVTPIPAAKGGTVASAQPRGPATPPSVPPGGALPGGGGTAGTETPRETPLKTGPEGIEQAPPETFDGMVMDPATFKDQVVYFEFDSSVVRTSQYPQANAVADHLKQNSAQKLLIDGHCDERGTEEYNRSLGERRALALREYLARQGVLPERVKTRSWGEDRPADPGHDEEAWARNRRGEFILLLPQ